MLLAVHTQTAYLNAIGTAVPQHDVHAKFVEFAPTLLSSARDRKLFARMAERAGIEHRFSSVQPHPDVGELCAEGFFARDAFPNTAQRMQRFERDAAPLAHGAVDALLRRIGPRGLVGVTHLLVTCCTGFYAPGLDLDLMRRYGLDAGVERTLVGFMGCNAAFNALKLARHIVRSDPAARVLTLNLELCTLHLQATDALEQVLCFLIFADGAAASLVSADPVGLELDRFKSSVLPDSGEQITWRIGGDGFDMRLAGEVPTTIDRNLPGFIASLLAQTPQEEVERWAVHPGGRSILDAVERTLSLAPERLSDSRTVLRDYGNMSSATVSFVLERMIHGDDPPDAGALGCAMGFGPGVTVESMLFRQAA